MEKPKRVRGRKKRTEAINTKKSENIPKTDKEEVYKILEKSNRLQIKLFLFYMLYVLRKRMDFFLKISGKWVMGSR